MWLTIGNLWAQLSNATAEETIWLSEYLAFDDRSSFFRKGAVEKIQLYDNVRGTFPAGMSGIVARGARKAGYSVQFLDQRRTPTIPIVGTARDAALYWLRPYQREAVDTLIEKARGIIHAPTGAGKTEMAAGLIRTIGGKWLFIVHNTKLMHQAAQRIDQRDREYLAGSLPPGTDPDIVDQALLRVGVLHSKCGLVGDGHWDEGLNVTCCTFQTLAKALRRKRGKFVDPVRAAKAKALLDSANGIIVDECHVLPADSFWNVLMSADNAYYRIGISGTPLARGDRRSVLAVAALGPVQYRITPDVLIDAGVLARPRIRMIACEQNMADPICPRCNGTGDQGFGPGSCGSCRGKGVRLPRWQLVQKKLISQSRKRNELVVNAVLNLAEKPCLVFVENIEHGKALLATLRAHNVELDEDESRASFVWGAHDTAGRDKAIKDLIEGRIDVLIASRIFQEGIDIPPIKSVVIASGGKSVIAALQKIGRGMRVTEGKTEIDVFDFNDTGHRWLKSHTAQRIKAYNTEGYEVILEASLFVGLKHG